MVMVATPLWPDAGVTTTLLLTLGTATPMWMLPGGTRVGFEEAVVKFNASPSVSPTAKGMAGVAVLSAVSWFAMAPIVGAPTVRRNELVVKLTLSSTTRVMVVKPCWPITGVMVTVRFVPPRSLPRVILPLGTKAVLEELALRWSSDAGVSASWMVTGSGPVGVFIGVFWATGTLIVGEVLAPATSAKRVPTFRLSIY